MGLYIFVSGFNKEGLISVMEKKRFEKPVAVPIKKRFAFTVFLKLCFKTPKYIEFISMRLKDGSNPGRGGGGAYDRMVVYN